MPPDEATSAEQPEYGPRGYLPPRAARRARKIVLREPMGLQWPVAAAIAGVLVLLAGGLLLWTRTGPPGPPFVPVGDLAAVDPRGVGEVEAPDGTPVLVLRGAGGMSALAAPGADVSWCVPRSRLVSSAGDVWQADGRAVGGAGSTSLARLPAQVHDGTVYVDVESGGTVLEPVDRGESAACPDAG